MNGLMTFTTDNQRLSSPGRHHLYPLWLFCLSWFLEVCQLADVEQHFQALAQAPTEVLRHIGSPFAPAKEQSVPLSLAQAA